MTSTNNRPRYSIKFPLVKERTGWKRGLRFRAMPDRSGLSGARACAALSVRSAVLNRDWGRYKAAPDRVHIERLRMRMASLWARVFAGQIESTDARLLAAEAAYHRAADDLIRKLNADLVAA